jgi:hypothetical protein
LQAESEGAVAMNDALILNILMYGLFPLWLAAGLADYLCHRRTRIETTSGWRESMLHLLLFAEMGVPLLAVLLLETNAFVFLVMILGLLLHQATTFVDLAYATRTRGIPWYEQHVHSWLEMLPFAGLMLIAILHWGQFTALFGFGSETADFSIRWKQTPLPLGFVIAAILAALLVDVLPVLEELARGLKAAGANARVQSAARRSTPRIEPSLRPSPAGHDDAPPLRLGRDNELD